MNESQQREETSDTCSLRGLMVQELSDTDYMIAIYDTVGEKRKKIKIEKITRNFQSECTKKAKVFQKSIIFQSGSAKMLFNICFLS